MPTAAAFGFFPFLAGMGSTWCFGAAFVIAIEYSGPKFMTYLGNAFVVGNKRICAFSK